MPPKKTIGARKKTAKPTRPTPRKAAARATPAEPAPEETVPQNPSPPASPQNPKTETPTPSQKPVETPPPSSTVLEPCSAVPRNESEPVDAPVKSAPSKIVKKVVRKVVRKIPVKVLKKKEEKEADSEKGKSESAQSAEEKEENAEPDLEKVQSVEETVDNADLDQEKAQSSAKEENAEPDVEKKVKKRKKVVVVKKIVKKPKAVEEKEKVEELGKDGEMVGLTECQKRRKVEVFVGGLNKNAKEEDIREVFGKVGEIVEVRLMIDSRTGKNKGYAFVRYAAPAQAKRAVTELSKAEVCGKQCAVSALEGNDTLYLGNIDKKWKKDDISKILQGIGIDKIDSLTLMPDPKDPECNRGFAFLDFETNKEAQVAFKKLQNQDAFVDGRVLKVAWAEPYNEPDEEELEKVKAVFVEGVPDSWDEKKIRECFEKYGEVGKIALSRNMLSSKRKDYAFVNFSTREAALSCVESFDKDPSAVASEVNLKVSIAKPMQKSKKSKKVSKTSEKDSFKDKAAPSRPQSSILPKSASGSKGKNSSQGLASKSRRLSIREDNGSSYRDYPRGPRERASWREMDYSREPDIPDYGISPRGGKRIRYVAEEDVLYDEYRGYPRPRVDVSYPVTSPSYGSFPPNGGGYDYYRRPSYDPYGMGPSYGGTIDIPRQYPSYERPGEPRYRTGPYSR